MPAFVDARPRGQALLIWDACPLLRCAGSREPTPTICAASAARPRIRALSFSSPSRQPRFANVSAGTCPAHPPRSPAPGFMPAGRRGHQGPPIGTVYTIHARTPVRFPGIRQSLPNLHRILHSFKGLRKAATRRKDPHSPGCSWQRRQVFGGCHGPASEVGALPRPR